jgi:hypothetical protein
MIFTSLGILVAAGGFLIAGIVRSSVPLLVVSLIATAGATILLLATADLARRREWERTNPQLVPAMSGASSNGADAGSPLLGYNDMTAAQISSVVSSGGLTFEQLVAVKQYEKANAARKTVLDRLDRALRS